MAAMRAAGLLMAMVGAVLSGCGAGGGGAGGSSSSAGSTAGSTGGASPCVPGAQSTCPCLGGKSGIQICKADGLGYDACQGCDGSGGSGGGATSTSTAGTGGTATSTGTATSSSVTSSASTGGAPPTMLDLHDAILYDNPINMADWPVTTTITDLEFQYMGADGVHVEFDKKDGPGRWPDITPPGWMGPLEYTLGMAEYINGQWYASAAIQFWNGLDASGGNVALDMQVGKNWYYDSRWGMLEGRQPATGEIIGIFVVAGNARGVKDDGSESPVHERSNVVLVPMPDVNGAKYTF
jgi:hypothetical protein